MKAFDESDLERTVKSFAASLDSTDSASHFDFYGRTEHTMDKCFQNPEYQKNRLLRKNLERLKCNVLVSAATEINKSSNAKTDSRKEENQMCSSLNA